MGQWLGWAALQVAGVSCRVPQPWGADCEVGTVAPAFCVLATHEWSQLTKCHPGLRSDEEQHVFPPTEDLWLRLTSGGQDTNCELGVGRGMARSLPPVLWGAALPGWTGSGHKPDVEPTLGLAIWILSLNWEGCLWPV